MSLRTKIVLLNASVLAIALLAAAIALAGLWAALGPFHQAVQNEASAVAVAERLDLEPAEVDVIEAALDNARAAERAVTRTALIASALPIALLAAGGAACAAFSLRFSRRLLERLTALADATHRVAGGDRAVRVLVSPTEAERPGSDDEVDSLIDSFNRMVDQLAEAEARAREADAFKSRLFSGVSHDLRTPLTTIAGLLESLRRDEWDGATRTEFLDVAHGEAVRLTHLVSDLLDLSRLEAHAWVLDREPVDLASLVRSLVADLSLPGGLLGARDVSVDARGRCVVWGDDLQLRRVLQNLLANAAKFSPPGEPISVETYHDLATGAVQVAVADRGPGVAPADAPHIFDRFYRGAAGTGGATTPGTGLGLAIAKGIVETHGGRIWVEPSPAGGARFVFTVPGAVPDESGGGADLVAPSAAPAAAPPAASAVLGHNP